MSTDEKLVARSGFAEVWWRLRRVNPYSKPVLFVMLVLPGSSILLFEAPYYGFENQRFWLVAALSHTVLVVGYLLFMLPFVKIPRLSQSALGKLSAVMLAYGLRVATLVLLVNDTPTQELSAALQRAPGDVTITLVLWVALATISTAETDYQKAKGQLTKVSLELEEQRDRSSSAAREANRRLKKLAMNLLQEELEKITHGLRAARLDREVWRLGAEIKKLIEGKVRPLSKEIMQRMDLLSDQKIRVSSRSAIRNILDYRYQPRQDTRFLLSYVVGSLNIFVTILQLSNWVVASTVQLASLSFLAIGCLSKFFWRKQSSIAGPAAIAWLTGMSLIAYLPTLYVINLWTSEFETLGRIQVTAYLVWLLLLFAFSGWTSFQRLRQEGLEQVQRQQESLRRELALMDQAIWVAQRKWSYLIHGTVQSSLTVASSRLIVSETVDEKVVRQVIKDVEKAKRALQEAVEFRLSSSQLIKELTRSWEGLCSVHFEGHPSVHQALDSSEGARTCFNELSKELVSNAYRHGKASNIWISAYIGTNNDLRLISSNDGSPIPESHLPGLGFSMFDELTSEWAIETGPSQRITATIPIS